MKKKLNIRPDTGVYGTYKRISYQPWTALAEFVDNSTQSFYDHKTELFDTKYYRGLVIEITYIEDSTNGDEIRILDNAFGMDFSDFQRALILDRPPLNTKGRNEFGMGLKAAACWFGNLWSVETTALGSIFKYRTEIDIDNLVKYKNEEIDFEEERVNQKEHYTLITIKRLNKKIKGKRIERKIHDLLSSIYRVDLRSGEISIFYNGISLSYKEVTPYIDEYGKTWKKDIHFTVPYKESELEVKGFIGIRIPSSPRDAGYTLLRRGRVIVGGPDKNYRPNEIFGASTTFPYQRLYGELEMDDWPVTQAKDAFDWSNEDLESKLIDSLKEISDEYKKKSESIRIREKVKVLDVVESLEKAIPTNEAVSNVKIEIQETSNHTNNSQVTEPTNLDDQDDEPGALESESRGMGVEIEGNLPIKISLTHNQKDYCFITILDDTNSKAEWLKIETTDIVKNEYSLTLNSSHVFFYPYIQKKDFLVVLIKFSVALAISEINSYAIGESGKISPSHIRLTMGRILEDLTDE